MNRRSFLAGSLALTTEAAFAMGSGPDAKWFNPCGKLSSDLLRHELTRAAFDGLEMRQVWDCHAHLLGFGESGGGAWVTPKMQTPLRLAQYARFHFFLNAACVDPDGGNVDNEFVARLKALLDDFLQGAKAMVMAFDRVHDLDGKPRQDDSAFYIPNAYAERMAARFPDRLEWTASIHPYREDAADAVDQAVKAGAVAVKWLPPAMGIDPASPRCDRFYDAMARHDLPLITHGGAERAVEGAHQPLLGNVLRLRRPLERGVRVVVAHCASVGEDIDLDRGADGPRVESFVLFERLMAERAHEGRLYGDVSAMPQKNRMDRLPAVLAHREWSGRLLNGSDYPLPGVLPLFSIDEFVARGWLKPAVGEHLRRLRAGNALLFDFVLKRHLEIDGARFGNATFETARVFRRERSANSSDNSASSRPLSQP